MWRRLLAARRLGGLAAALPRVAEPLVVSRAVCGRAVWRAAEAQDALSGEGWSCSAVARSLGSARSLCAAASSGVEPAEPPVPAAAPPEREATTAARGDADAESGPSTLDAKAVQVPTRTKRAPSVGVRNEKTASGQPKPDVRTVARLVELGWWDTAEAAEAAYKIEVEKSLLV